MSNRTSPKDQRLATALQFANLGLEQQGQAERAQAHRIASAVQMLGLMQQQEQDAARQKQAADLLGFNRDELGFRREAETNRSAQASSEQQRALDLGILRLLESNPAYGDLGLNFASKIKPELGAVRNEAAHKAEAERAAKLAANGIGPDGQPIAVAGAKPLSNSYLDSFVAQQPIPQALKLAQNMGTLAEPTGSFLGGAAGALGFGGLPQTTAPGGLGGTSGINLLQLLNYLHR